MGRVIAFLGSGVQLDKLLSRLVETEVTVNYSRHFRCIESGRSWSGEVRPKNGAPIPVRIVRTNDKGLLPHLGADVVVANAEFVGSRTKQCYIGDNAREHMPECGGALRVALTQRFNRPYQLAQALSIEVAKMGPKEEAKGHVRDPMAKVR